MPQRKNWSLWPSNKKWPMGPTFSLFQSACTVIGCLQSSSTRDWECALPVRGWKWWCKRRNNRREVQSWPCNLAFCHVTEAELISRYFVCGIATSQLQCGIPFTVTYLSGRAQGDLPHRLRPQNAAAAPFPASKSGARTYYARSNLPPCQLFCYILWCLCISAENLKLKKESHFVAITAISTTRPDAQIW